MSRNPDYARRAARLLRWYPPSWRERYGEEFADHLVQEFEDRQVDLKRSVNVAYKGLIARVDNIGFSNGALSPGAQTRASLGASFVLVAVMTVLALNYWSMAMLRWSGRTYHPVPIDVTTGILTAAAGLLVLVLLAMVLILVASAARQIARGRARPIVVPSIFAVVSVGFLVFSERWLPRYVVLVSHLRPSGLRWTHPGPAAYGLAMIARVVTQPWVSMWSPGITGIPTSRTVMNDLAPLAILTFAVAVAILVRRVELPRVSDRLGSATVVLLATLSGVFFVALLAWLNVSGPAGDNAFGFTGDVAGIAYFAFLALVTLLVARLGLLARRNSASQKRNHIEILV